MPDALELTHVARMPRLCETVVAATTDALRLCRDEVTDADLVELRLDAVADCDARAAVVGRHRPVVVTCRPRWEGGLFEGSEEERERLLREALAAGAEFVDVEWRAPWRDRLLADAGSRVVLSFHDFTGVPAGLADLVRAMSAAGPGVVKVAITAHRLRDLLPLAALGRAAGRDPRRVLLAMGAAGFATRVLAARFGSCWTYAGAGVAPGQVPAAQMVREFRFRSIGRETPVYGVVGRPVAHSASPAMHNAAFEALGLDAVYVPLEAADFTDFDETAAALGLAGASVTAPYKRDAWRACRNVDADARRLGAVNTLRREPEGDGWAGCNTDVAGFLAPLSGRRLQASRATVLGAGGAARAVVAGLAGLGARITVRARRRGDALEVAGLVGAATGRLPVPRGSWDVLVNATPVGTAPGVDDSPMAGQPLDGALVYDLVYNPPDTRLIRDARAAGLETVSGLDMLVAQAALQFEWWTGRQAPVEPMREAAQARLGAGRRRAEHTTR